MLFYSLFVSISLFLVFILNTVFKNGPFWLVLLMVILCFIFEFALDALIALIIRRGIPEERIKPDAKIYQVKKWEKGFYEKLGIKFWKDKVLELGQASGFKKDHLNSTGDIDYLKRFIIESCYGESIHFVSVIMSFSVMLLGFWMPQYLWSIFLPASFINAFVNLLPALIQRYVRPRLEVLYKRSLRTKEKAINQGQNEQK